MARLLNLLPCEKVIVDRAGMPSLIALFQNINVALSEGQDITEVPRSTITYKEWAVFSEWRPDPEDVGTTAHQILEVEYPDGTMAPIRGKLPFSFENTGSHRSHQNILGFPVGHEGRYVIRVWLERDERAITPVSTYELFVSHTIPSGSVPRQVLGES